MTRDSEFKDLVRKRMEITGESYTQAMRPILDAARTAVPSTEAARPRRPVLQRWVPRPWHLPQTELPASVPIGTLHFDLPGHTAIAITGISAFSSGFEIFITQLVRRDHPGFDPDPGVIAEPLFFELSLRFSDGRAVATGRPPGDAEATEPFLQRRGGGGTSHYRLMQWWAWPLPPTGPLEFICRLGTAESRVGIDAQLILDAAQRSVRVWPAGEG